jgi:hypothetical protein
LNTKQKKKGGRSDFFSPRQEESENEFNAEEVNMIVSGIKNELSSQAERITNLEEKLSLILEAVTGGKKRKEKAEKKKVRINSDRKMKRKSAQSMRSEKGSNVPTPSSALKNLPEIPEVVVIPPKASTLEKPLDGSSSSSSSDSSSD